MPFGAELQNDGRVRFRLWAPAAQRVDLCLVDRTAGETVLPMAAEDGGWFTLLTDRATNGSRYRYRVDNDLHVPDPAARFQPEDVHGPSQVIDPGSWHWNDADWRGRPWEEAVIYELHVGAFSAEGNFAAVKKRLDYLVELGVTAIELMPVADFPGSRNWGYDGVLPFAPDSSYGIPDALKDLVQSAHQKGIMVFLDVVYNHFGPDGNYLHAYAPEFFTERHHTPWGAALNFDGKDSETVRQFFIHNALYWLEEYHLDGLRLDAVHAIVDESSPDILEELAEAVQQGPGRDRYVHLVLENDHNAAHYLNRSESGSSRQYVAQWNDDMHHAMHILLTAERGGYYADYADRPVWYLGRCLTEGFGYQGEPSPYRDDAVRGEPSRTLPLTAFVSFLQNHDQVGNRAFGERISSLIDADALRAMVAVMLLAPSPPLLFMGEEFAAEQPFLFFCDFNDDLAVAVTEGRRREFARFEQFADPKVRETIPDPNAQDTFERSKLDWNDVRASLHNDWLAFYRRLLALRHNRIMPLLSGMQGNTAAFVQLGEASLRVQWHLGSGSVLILLANLGEAPVQYTEAALTTTGDTLFTFPASLPDELAANRLPAWSVGWFLQGESA
ncbi:malto-oligosyltrehalose trehalohydrolase [Nitrosomonas sp.]|uniref:malto-oligosyltrehalose trehalohydrolase n=1 Tax=Nitrosomonas sp. TaxID=42353 RepID=UPI0025CEC9D6|nr:malto-oligosyltrehalose trehalohydrolase [Nitrosomonas sp.]